MVLTDLDDEESLIKLVDHNSIIPTNQDDENIITNDQDIITTINEDICIVDNNINTGNSTDDENITTNDKDIITTINEDICTRTKKIENQRKEAHCNLELQAIKMKTRSNKKFPPALVGNTVRVPISDVDRGRGVLKQLYARSQFTVCQQNVVALEEVNHEKELGLRSIATQEATGS
ncbi:hypothetical protein ACI65C_005545 [Semiaphis heraclei]